MPNATANASGWSAPSVAVRIDPDVRFSLRYFNRPAPKPVDTKSNRPPTLASMRTDIKLTPGLTRMRCVH